jgi:hypothetical protein
MKKITWQDCETRGATFNSPSQNLILGNSEVKPDMQVSARYNNMNIRLQIKREISKHVFAATILHFEKADLENLDNLAEGDEVEIDRQHICWLSGD